MKLCNLLICFNVFLVLSITSYIYLNLNLNPWYKAKPYYWIRKSTNYKPYVLCMVYLPFPLTSIKNPTDFLILYFSFLLFGSKQLHIEGFLKSSAKLSIGLARNKIMYIEPIGFNNYHRPSFGYKQL